VKCVVCRTENDVSSREFFGVHEAPGRPAQLQRVVVPVCEEHWERSGADRRPISFSQAMIKTGLSVRELRDRGATVRGASFYFFRQGEAPTWK